MSIEHVGGEQLVLPYLGYPRLSTSKTGVADCLHTFCSSRCREGQGQ
jgi:hypothetical protein